MPIVIVLLVDERFARPNASEEVIGHALGHFGRKEKNTLTYRGRGRGRRRLRSRSTTPSNAWFLVGLSNAVSPIEDRRR